MQPLQNSFRLIDLQAQTSMFTPPPSGPSSRSFATLLFFPGYARSLPPPTSQTLPLPKISKGSLLFPLSNQYTRRFCGYVLKSSPSSPVRPKKYASTNGASRKRASSSSRPDPLTEIPISGIPVTDNSLSTLSGRTVFSRTLMTLVVVRSARARRRLQRRHGSRHRIIHQSTSVPG